MKIMQSACKAANALIDGFLVCFLLMAALYSLWALWDNARIYEDAQNVQADMQLLKPEPAGSGTSSSFSRLAAINRDVCAWITMDNTNIDYPILQGETNLSYINRNVYGEFALAGSIYLDSRNHKSFEDPYSLLYGHHMENGQMFGDLDLYKQADFFKVNRTGTLLLAGQIYDLEVFACLLLDASDEMVFSPEQWQSEPLDALLDYLEDNALHLHPEALSALTASKAPVQLLALSTCSPEFTDARTVVVARMCPVSPAFQGGAME